jgi:hypothetical protein
MKANINKYQIYRAIAIVAAPSFMRGSGFDARRVLRPIPQLLLLIAIVWISLILMLKSPRYLTI